jgi:hypothetical protein
MARGPGPVARQKERIGSLRRRLMDIDLERSRLAIQLEEAEAALVQMTGRKATEPTLALEGDPK